MPSSACSAWLTRLNITDAADSSGEPVNSKREGRVHSPEGHGQAQDNDQRGGNFRPRDSGRHVIGVGVDCPAAGINSESDAGGTLPFRQTYFSSREVKTVRAAEGRV